MKCPKCGCENIVNNGLVYLKENGILTQVQRHKCNNKTCNYQFTKNKCVNKYPNEVKFLALKLLWQNLSYREVAYILEINSHSIIKYWDTKDTESHRQLKVDKDKLETLIDEIKSVGEFIMREYPFSSNYYCYKKCLKVLNNLSLI